MINVQDTFRAVLKEYNFLYTFRYNTQTFTRIKAEDPHFWFN